MAELSSRWPSLAYAEWDTTLATLQRFMQIVGKVRLACTPWINHSWHVTLYVTPVGLSTGLIPHSTLPFQIETDFLQQRLTVQTSNGDTRTLDLRPQSVAIFYQQFMSTLAELDLSPSFYPYPNELPDQTHFAEDHDHAAYDAASVERFQQALVQITRVFTIFRARFSGKVSPVHFFWGSFDLATTRFSGRPAPEHPGGIPHLPDWITREAYSHEVSSCGFWPGGPIYPEPVFYSYAYPQPPGFEHASIEPAAAFYHQELHEWVLPYAAVQTAADPDAMLLSFLQSTYAAAADAAQWDRSQLEFTWQPPR